MMIVDTVDRFFLLTYQNEDRQKAIHIHCHISGQCECDSMTDIMDIIFIRGRCTSSKLKRNNNEEKDFHALDYSNRKIEQ